MKPVKATRATLQDLLDRVLDKGLVLGLDLIVCVADVPLLGLSLRAALAGIETMLEHGIMLDWDEAHRAWARNRRKENTAALDGFFGTLWYESGVYKAWVPCRLLTCGPELRFVDASGRCLGAFSKDAIETANIRPRENVAGRLAQDIEISLKGGGAFRFHPLDDPQRVLETCLERFAARRVAPVKSGPPPALNGGFRDGGNEV